jgi:hypothetical protein
VPPGFPQKPASYTAWSDWNDYSFYQSDENGTNWSWIWEAHFSTYLGFNLLQLMEDTTAFLAMPSGEVKFNPPQLTEDTLVPYTMKLKGFKDSVANGDSLFGAVLYDVDTSLRWDEKSKWVAVFWSPHLEVDLDSSSIIQLLKPSIPIYYKIMWPYASDFIAVDSHFDVVNIGKIKGYRHRGRWRQSQSDQYWQPTGSFTMYYIPTEKFDFHIICQQLTYLYDGMPWQGYEYPPEVYDTLPHFIIKTYPDRIRRLERAVEQTFRVKE